MLLAHQLVPPRSPSSRPPLLLMLHGIGADENDLLPLARAFDPRLLVVAARAPHDEPPGYRWYQIDWSVVPPRADANEIAAARDLLARYVEELVAEQHVDTERVFLLGFSQGAIMSTTLLLSRPDLVRGVIAHSGRLSRVPGADATAAQLTRAHALVLHGSDDPVVPVAQGRKAYEVLAGLIGDRAEWHEYPGLGHGISEESLGEALRWVSARLDDAT
jgi:phospholipase/carboxylesterase